MRGTLQDNCGTPDIGPGASTGTDPAAVSAPTYARQSAEFAAADDDMDQGVAENDVNMDFIGSFEPVESDRDSISELLLTQLGSCARSYRREAQNADRKIISEMYSPPRVTAELKKMGRKHLVLGFALDLTVLDPDDGMPWDLSGWKSWTW